MKNKFLFVFLTIFTRVAFAQPTEGNLLAHWKDTTIQGTNAYDNAYNEVWGFTAGSHEYAVIGSTVGTHILDVTDPENIFERYRFRGKDAGPQIIHRDYHDFKGYLYAVSDEGASSLQIIKIDELPDTAYLVYDNDSIFVQAHNIFIDTAHARLYSFSGRLPQVSNARGVGIFDISDPAQPDFLTHTLNFGTLRPSHVHDGYVRDHIAFLNCGRDGFAMMDFSDVKNPKPLAALPSNAYLQSGYNHSGWANDDCSHYFFADETWGTDLKTLPLGDLEDLNVSVFFDADNEDPHSIPHNLVVGCNYLYASYYYDGLQVYDITDPNQPERVMYFQTSSRDIRRNYEGAWGVYPHLPSGNILVSDMQEGLFVIQGLNDNCKPNKDLKPCTQISSYETISVSSGRFKVFPNPIGGSGFKIEKENSDYFGEAEISLTDLTGKTLLFEKAEFSLGPEIIDFELDHPIPNGIYFLKIEIKGAVFTEKVAVIK